MEKMIFTDRAPIRLHPEPANAGHGHPSLLRRWLKEKLNQPEPTGHALRWRIASMKQAYNTKPEQAGSRESWHETQHKGLSPWAYSEVFTIPAADAWQRFGVLHITMPEITANPEKITV